VRAARYGARSSPARRPLFFLHVFVGLLSVCIRKPLAPALKVLPGAVCEQSSHEDGLLTTIRGGDDSTCAGACKRSTRVGTSGCHLGRSVHNGKTAKRSLSSALKRHRGPRLGLKRLKFVRAHAGQAEDHDASSNGSKKSHARAENRAKTTLPLRGIEPRPRE
jgi:hypothetical protein